MNGLVLIPSGASTALVIGPSAEIQHLIREVLGLGGMSVGAVFLTHGYPDCVWDATAMSTWEVDGGAVPVYVPGPDTYRMDAPASSLPMSLPDFMGEWVKPADLRKVPSDSFEVCPGIWLHMVPTPKHTEGLAVFLGENPLDIRVSNRSFYRSDEAVPWVMSTDVLLEDSVGHTNLPRNDETRVRHSLRTISSALGPRTVLVPGHGPTTTLADEVRSNQYLIRARRIG